MMIERMPPKLSTGSVVSLTWEGTNLREDQRDHRQGRVTRKTDPQSKCSSKAPETSGPGAEMPPPMPDQSAIARVFCPDQSAVIKASVVGNAMPAEARPVPGRGRARRRSARNRPGSPPGSRRSCR